MTRRKLNMVYSSSDDDESQPPPRSQPQLPQPDNDVDFFDAVVELQHEEEIQNPSGTHFTMPNISAVTLTSTSTATEALNAAVELSDEDFIDVPENLSPPSPPPSISASSVEAVVISNPSVGSTDCPVGDQLRKMGFGLKREWLGSCLLGLRNSVPSFEGLGVEVKAKHCLGQALYSDLNSIGAGVLPDNVCGLHLVDLAGPFVLQVDEIVNISCSLRERYKNAAPGLKRCLKLSMTDGMQRVFGMEYRPIKCLEALAPAGFKVVIRNVNVRRGLLMLVPEVLEVLGGSVEELEAARQRLTHEVNKPPRGKRTRTGLVPPLSTRATRAAWPHDNMTSNTALQHDANHGQRSTPTTAIHASAQFNVNAHGVDTVWGNRHAPTTNSDTCRLHNIGGADQGRINREVSQYSSSRQSGQHPIIRESGLHSDAQESAQHSNTTETTPHSRSTEFAQHTTSAVSVPRFTSRESSQLSSISEAYERPSSREANSGPPTRESIMLSSATTTVLENEDAHMIHFEENPLIFSVEREQPFIYLANLLAKWIEVKEKEPFIRGKIKCFTTGVKGFKYKHQSTFELQAYVDDGSLISEILVDHKAVQKYIGYSPEEVTAAVTSSDSNEVSAMRNILLQFQTFLTNFEGIMLIEMNRTSNLPIALEMNEGCTVSDAWLLLRRLKPGLNHDCTNDSSNVINLSP